AEEASEVVRHGAGRVVLEEVPRTGNDLELGARDHGVEPAPALDRDPFVLLAPEDQHRGADASVERFDLVGVALVRLRDLTVERVMYFGAEPGQDVRGEVLLHE